MKKARTIFLLLFSANAISQIPTTNLQGYWKLDGNALDQISNNDGVVNGASPTLNRCDITDDAMLFDGTDDYIEFSVDTLDVVDELTISCWIKKSTFGDPDIVISKFGTQAEDSGYNLQFNQYGAIELRGRDGNSSFTQTDNTTNICDDKWHHVVGVVDGSTWSIWVDTVLIASVDNGHSNVNIGDSDDLLTFGRRSYWESSVGSWNNLDGSLDDVAIYNRAITESEIIQLFNSSCFSELEEQESNHEIKFKLFPNPTQDLLTVQSESTIRSITVYDNSGKKHLYVEGINSKEVKLGTENLVPGTYFMQISGDEYQLKSTFIKI